MEFVFLLAWIALGVVTGRIPNEKGRSSLARFLIGGVTGIIGLFVIAVTPSRARE